MAEFPGGKCEADELPRACVVRECLEETGLIVEATEQLATVFWSYPHGDVELHFWLCRCVGEFEGALPPAVQRPFRWLPECELRQQDFPPANQSVLELLQRRAEALVLAASRQIRVLFFAAARDAAGVERCEVSVPRGASLGAVQRAVFERHPDLSRHAGSLLWAVNNSFADSQTCVPDDAEVACFPPVSGG
jgi:mutator protein MutT